MTNRDMISRVRSVHKLLGDSSITDRAILAELKGSAKLLIKQATDKRKLWASPALFSVIPCLEMKEVPLAECCDYISDEMIYRSIEPIPQIAEGNFGLLIQGVFSIDGNMKFNPSSPTDYINTKKLKLSRACFWIENNYLYVTKLAKKVRLVAYFEDETLLKAFIEKCDCGGNLNKNTKKCISALDDEFKCPGYMTSNIISIVSKTLLESYFRIRTDITSDSKDDQTNEK
jgi:hypothetical protein